jgi:hypothetical protein
MRHTRASDFLVGTGETAARAIMLGLVVIAGILLAPVVVCALIYGALKRQPHHVEPEYAIVE